MAKINSNLQILWFTKLESGSPDLNQKPFDGTVEEAVAEMTSISTTPGFMLGQILEADGKVCATVANGGVKIQPDAMSAH